MTDCVKFVGWVDNPEEFIAGLDLFTISSRYEGLGTIILDAIYAQSCVVATPVGGIPEMITDNKTGILSQRADAQSYTEALMRVVNNPDYQAELAKNALQFVHKNFSVQKMVDGNFKLYQSLLTVKS